MAGVLSRLKAFGAFWWDFIVGDDWRIAAGVILGLALTAALTHWGVPAWWLVPLAAIGLLTHSLNRATRSPRRRS